MGKDTKTKRWAEQQSVETQELTANQWSYLANFNLATDVLGTSNEITVTDNGDDTVTISLPDAIKLDGLTASRLLATNGNKLTVSVSTLTSWIIGTSSQIIVTNNGDGTITLSTPQAIATTSNVLFNRVNKTAIWHAYGGFQNKSETIAVSAANSWAWITNAGNDLWTGVEEDGIAVSGDILTIANAGDYFGKLTITLSGLTGKDFQVRIYNITTASQVAYVIGTSTTGLTNFTNISLPLYIEASAGDTFRFEITCTTDGSDPVVRSAIYYIAYLHD